MVCFAAMVFGAETPYPELRALWDMSRFPFEEISQTNSPWLMLRIKPAADSGVSSGIHINAETGQLVREPGKNVEVVMKGTSEQLARFDGEDLSRKQQPYSWGAPVMTRTKDVRRLLYSPFQSGGKILSRFWNVASQEDMFDPYFVVPGDWSSRTFSSYRDLQRAEGGRWMKIETKENRQRVTQQLAGENPIVALQAFRVLRVAARVSDDAQDYVAPKPSDLVGIAELKNRALLITVFLRETESVATVRGELSKLVTGATNLEQLRSLAMAARSVLDFGGGSDVDESKKVSREILNQCVEVAKKLPGDDKLKGELQMLSTHDV